MPHVVLQGPHNLDATLAACVPRSWSETHQGREITADSWMVELVVREGKLCQQIGVALIPRSQAQILLKLSAMGFPRPTLGVHRAVCHVSEVLQEYNPQLSVLWMSISSQEQAPEDIPPALAWRVKTPLDGSGIGK